MSKLICRQQTIPKGVDSTKLGSLLLFMMLSRERPNIDQRDLAYLEDSTDLNDFKGFIRDPKVK